MRNLILIIFFCIFNSLCCFAQNQKGEVTISIVASPYLTETNNEDDFGAIGLASVEFFLSNKVSLGGNFFTSSNTLLKNNSGTTIHSYGFIPSIQYYFVNKQKFNVFGQLGYGYGFEDLTRGNIQNSALTVFTAGPGAHYTIDEKLQIKLMLPYFSARNITINRNASSGIGVFLGLSFKI